MLVFLTRVYKRHFKSDAHCIGVSFLQVAAMSEEILKLQRAQTMSVVQAQLAAHQHALAQAEAAAPGRGRKQKALTAADLLPEVGRISAYIVRCSLV